VQQQIILADCKDALTPYRQEKERYYCPACQGHNLTFSPDGKWTCWNIPTREHRFEIIAQVIPNFQKYSPQVASKPYTVQLNHIEPAQLHFPLIVNELLAKVVGKKTTYWYSDKQQVIRLDYPHHKVIYPQVFDGKYWHNYAGFHPWIPYGLSRLQPYPGMVNLILVVEGQKCVEIAHQRGIPALCLESGDYSSQTTFDKLRVIKNKLKRLLLVVLPDHDLSGAHKASQLIRAANYFTIPALLLNPLEIKADLNSGDDIEQLISFDHYEFMHIVKQKLSLYPHHKYVNPLADTF
jgi:hypothetical protein